jgi:hypothetical protein
MDSSSSPVFADVLATVAYQIARTREGVADCALLCRLLPRESGTAPQSLCGKDEAK